LSLIKRTVGELLRLADGLDNHGELIHFLQSIVEEIPSTPRRIETHRTIALLARDLHGCARNETLTQSDTAL